MVLKKKPEHRNNYIQEYNINRIISLLEQDPKLTQVSYKFAHIHLPYESSTNSSFWGKTWLKRKVNFAVRTSGLLDLHIVHNFL